MFFDGGGMKDRLWVRVNNVLKGCKFDILIIIWFGYWIKSKSNKGSGEKLVVRREGIYKNSEISIVKDFLKLEWLCFLNVIEMIKKYIEVFGDFVSSSKIII